MEDFLIYLLKSAGLLTAFLLFYNILLKKDTTFIANRKFLLAGLITSAILPSIYFTKIVIINAPPSQLQWLDGNFPISEGTIQESMVSPLEIVAGIYILGVILMTLRLIIQLYSLSKVIISGKPKNISGGKFIETSKKIAPFSFLNYVVYNPGLHSKAELEFIIKHEKVHVTQYHSVDVMLANLNLIYQWYNPFAWFYLKSLQQNLEFIADREAVKQAGCKKEYQKVLVKISVEGFNLALTNNFYQSLIKKRIVMLNKSATGRSSAWKTALIVPALFAFIFLFNIKTVAQIQSEEQDKVTSEAGTNLEITFQILNSTKEEQLNSYSKLMKKYNVELAFEDVQRNGAGLITALTAKYLDKKNNSTGSITRENQDGIKGFVFYYNENEGPGFKSIDQAPEKRDHNLLRDLGESPLIVIAGKQYSTSQMAGKAVHITGAISSVAPTEAVKEYGENAKNGALLISEGRIIEDFKSELKEIDNQDKDAISRYIRFEKGKMPLFISVNKNVSKVDVKSGNRSDHTSGTGSTRTTRNFSNMGDIIYVVDGKILGSGAVIDTINPESISGINVLKGYSATSLYGKEAKDGAIIITTKKPEDTTKSKKFTFIPYERGIQDSLKLERTYIYDQVTFNKEGVLKKNRNFNAGRRVFYPELTGMESSRSFFRLDGKSHPSDKPLIIVDGKEMPADFNIKSMDNDMIEIITLIRGATAIEKYGDKAKDGAVEVTTKKKKKQE